MSDLVVGPYGQPKNCRSWAEWEPPGSSPTATLCHGRGRHEGHWYDPCPSRFSCKVATEKKQQEEREERARTRLTVLNPAKPYNAQPVVSTPNFRSNATPTVATLPQKREYPYHAAAVGHHTPIPVVPPQEFPVAMQVPYVHNPVVQGLAMSPTFLPTEGEGHIARIMKNAAQGALSGMAWHVFNYSFSVDLFQKPKK